MKTNGFNSGLETSFTSVDATSTLFSSNKTGHFKRVDTMFLKFDSKDHKNIGVSLTRKDAKKLIRELSRLLIIKTTPFTPNSK